MPTDEQGLFRAHVMTMYSRCNNDLTIMCERIAKVLQDSGRNDVNVSVDGRGSVITMAQSLTHASGREVPFRQKLDATVDTIRPPIGDPKKELEAVVGEVKHVQEVRFVGCSPPGTQPKQRRSFPKTERDARLEELPTSQYNGNYTLRRYGGYFPKHGNYGFYRRYGAAGAGAATAEFHSLPGGLPPSRTPLYS